MDEFKDKNGAYVGTCPWYVISLYKVFDRHVTKCHLSAISLVCQESPSGCTVTLLRNFR